MSQNGGLATACVCYSDVESLPMRTGHPRWSKVLLVEILQTRLIFSGMVYIFHIMGRRIARSSFRAGRLHASV